MSVDVSAGSAFPRSSGKFPAIPARNPAADVDTAAPSCPGSPVFEGFRPPKGLDPKSDRGLITLTRPATHDSVIVSASLVSAIHPSAALRLGTPCTCHWCATVAKTLAAAQVYTPAQASNGHMRSASLAAKSSQPHASKTATRPSRFRCGVNNSSTVKSARFSSSGRVRNLSILRPLALKVGTSGERPPGGLNSRAFVDELPPPPLPLDAGEVPGCGIASRRNSSYFTSLASNCTDVRIAADLAAEICVVVVPFEGGDSSFGDSSSARDS
mmetsp:Transcript_437/g.2042  ORF Transcript_437/g.2042 Transcript_437/m.2042 type:complete len:270 (-) Transcript_437:1113-1922(-)